MGQILYDQELNTRQQEDVLMCERVRVRGMSFETIERWCMDNSISYAKENAIINPETFIPEFDWVIPKDKHRTFFILRWNQWITRIWKI